MQNRRVVVILELDCDTPLDQLRDKGTWDGCLPGNEKVAQVQANVVKPKKAKAVAPKVKAVAPKVKAKAKKR